MENIRDLLQKKDQKLVLKENESGVFVKDLSSFVVKSVKELEHVMKVSLICTKPEADFPKVHHSLLRHTRARKSSVLS